MGCCPFSFKLILVHQSLLLYIRAGKRPDIPIVMSILVKYLSKIVTKIQSKKACLWSQTVAHTHTHTHTHTHSEVWLRIIVGCDVILSVKMNQL